MLIDTSKSPYAKVWSLPFDAVKWQEGFWKTRLARTAQRTVPHILKLFEDPEVFHAIENFRIAAGLTQGQFHGTVFGDGDFYKLLEALVSAGIATGDAGALDQAEQYIALIAKAQGADGYLSTKQLIAEAQGTGARGQDINDFELYNFGHLFTAAVTHHRLTGSASFLKIALRAAGYLEKLAQNPENIQTAVCPSHYMGLIELYRDTRDLRWLTLAKRLIDLRDQVPNGTDDNQDRHPLRSQDQILGHAVRAAYLYAGVADLYAETGEDALYQMLLRVYEDMTRTKLYITGGAGALYTGVSPYGDLFADYQKVHQAYGYAYQLPNVTAYNETCAALGNILWCHRLFALSPRAQYFDLIEQIYLNTALSAVSLDGEKYFYENMLRRTRSLPYRLTWPLERTAIIPNCFCCPTNLARFIAQASEYCYAVDENSVYAGLYGASEARIALKNGAQMTLCQRTAYPWDGAIRFELRDYNGVAFTLRLRIPGWAQSGTLFYNGQHRRIDSSDAGSYIGVPVDSDQPVVLTLDMPARLIAAHPMVEECAGQVAVQRGPIVYCVESADAPCDVDELYLPSDARFFPEPMQIDGVSFTALSTLAAAVPQDAPDSALYRPLAAQTIPAPLRLIPYFAWDNRGFGSMRVWLPLMLRA